MQLVASLYVTQATQESHQFLLQKAVQGGAKKIHKMQHTEPTREIFLNAIEVKSYGVPLFVSLQTRDKFSASSIEMKTQRHTVAQAKKQQLRSHMM